MAREEFCYNLESFNVIRILVIEALSGIFLFFCHHKRTAAAVGIKPACVLEGYKNEHLQRFRGAVL